MRIPKNSLKVRISVFYAARWVKNQSKIRGLAHVANAHLTFEQRGIRAVESTAESKQLLRNPEPRPMRAERRAERRPAPARSTSSPLRRLNRCVSSKSLAGAAGTVPPRG